MVVRVAKGLGNHGQAAEGVTDFQFLGHAHPPVQLNSLLADVTAGVGNMDFCCGYGPAAFVGIRAVGLHAGQTGHGFGLFMDDRHLDHAVLQGLKRTDRYPELLTGLEVLKRCVIRNCMAPTASAQTRAVA